MKKLIAIIFEKDMKISVFDTFLTGLVIGVFNESPFFAIIIAVIGVFISCAASRMFNSTTKTTNNPL